jgi:hypothetical protein
MPEFKTIYRYRDTVYPWHGDHTGRMNVMWHVGRFDEASWRSLAALRLTSRAGTATSMRVEEPLLEVTR